ncbi:type 1 glutamine amidotransferase family protein [Nitrococcus mobilis]|uniref:Uncharacterized protein n=1 Tax=Nitrococcus mobilis Nb-231 TaxID=314278 RepID=A4BMG7_9GAMM|nr:hypothetical protein [Nitrococcus mobilis]EAR23505.1 hypothetical protein NB231_16833 [Nitrococcus mobilis Nb-231]
MNANVWHIGCNSRPVRGESNKGWWQTAFADLFAGTAVYFAYSFAAYPNSTIDTPAECDYCGYRFAVPIMGHNMIGCQFPSEESGGIRLHALCGWVATAK